MSKAMFLVVTAAFVLVGCAPQAKPPEPKKNPAPQYTPGKTAAAPTEELQVNPAGKERGPGR